ncbi:MAG: DUF5127 domain-containing protein, partial [Bacteroidales bacterium]|nr:DUF5127 domain-containing protein [Bacteroidales bacterium]
MTKARSYFLFLIICVSITIFSDDKKAFAIQSIDLSTSLRAPAYPLVTVDPYFSAWSFTDNLYDDPVRHWTGKEFGFIGAIRVDGKTYRFLGTENLPLIPLIPTSAQEKWEAVYTFNEPVSENWTALEFDDTTWKKGQAAFGTKNEPNLSTLWETSDIWVRRIFNLEEDLKDKSVYLNYSHDDIFELYINGKKVVDTGYSWKYNVLLELPDEVKTTLKKGKNVIAAHCHNRTGGGYVDFGLFEKETQKESFVTAAVQKSASVLPTQTFYTFECGPVELELIFSAPLFLDDLDLMSRPVNYVTYRVRSDDNNSHSVQIYFETTPQWAVNTDDQAVNFERIEKNGQIHLKTGTIEQPILRKKGDDLRIDWGYFYMTGRSESSSVMNFGNYWETKKDFLTQGRISATAPDFLSSDMTKGMTVLAYSNDLGNVSSRFVEDYIMLGYDDLYSVQYFHDNLLAYWKKDG